MLKIDPKKYRMMMVFANAALTKVLMMVGFGWLGFKLDQNWGTKPWMLFLGVLIGFSLGLWYLIFVSNRFNREDGD